jgi:Fe-S cluster assembly ATP-binding protein
MIEIKNLKVSVEEKQILKELNLSIGKGEVHAIMGPNGSGKSTLSYALSGKEGYNVEGEVIFNKKNLLELNAEERAQEGVFLAFQYPIEIPGVFTNNFLRTSLNSVRKANNQKELNAVEFLKIVKEKAFELKIDPEMLSRPLNVGFSGGEKKRNEILQMSLLEPSFIIMDETDSGLDIDALKIVSNGVNTLRNQDRSFLIITHYQRLLNYIKPDFVHVLSDGKIVKTGDWKLALELEDEGYGKFVN